MDLIDDDPLSVVMWACAGLGCVGLLWASVALAMRKPARAAARMLGFGTFGYLATASASVVLRVSFAASPPTGDESESESTVAAVDPRQVVGAQSKPASEPKPPEEPAIDPAIAGPPQRTGREALRFANDVAQDERCKDARAVAGAVRDLAAAVASEPRAKLDKAVERLEDCRKKVVWVKAASVRRKRVDAREAWALSLKTRMKDEGTPVFVSLRGAAHERIRLGGGTPTVTKLRAQFDGPLRKELEALGFTEVAFADMSSSEEFELSVPSDHELAVRELASFKLDDPITVP